MVSSTTIDNLKSLSRSRLLCAVVGNSGGQYVAHLALSLHQPTRENRLKVSGHLPILPVCCCGTLWWARARLKHEILHFTNKRFTVPLRPAYILMHCL